MRYPCYLIDLSIPDTYSFTVNPNTENTREMSRSYSETVRSSNTGGPLLQQGAPGPRTLEYSGTFLEPAQDTALWIWFQRSNDRTVVFQDWQGHQYLVLIEKYSSTRRRVAMNPKTRGTAAESHVYDWSMTLRVVKVISGPMAVVT